MNFAHKTYYIGSKEININYNNHNNQGIIDQQTIF